jgi:hypothetical protein
LQSIGDNFSYRRTNSILSKIEENWEKDELSGHASDESKEGSVSPDGDQLLFLKFEEKKKEVKVLVHSSPKDEVIIGAKMFRNPLRISYVQPLPLNQDDFKYRSFDEYIKNKLSKGSDEDQLYDRAEEYLQTLGCTLKELRNKEEPINKSQSSKVIVLPVLSKKPRKKLKKKIVKKKKGPNRKKSNWKNISLKLIEIEKEIEQENNSGNSNQDRKNSQNYLAVSKPPINKRNRFHTWGNDREENVCWTSNNEESVKLEEKGEYFKNFKNYSFKMYDPVQEFENNASEKQNSNGLLLNLTVWPPLVYDKRKVSYNSHNQNNLEQISEGDNIDKSENSLNQGHWNNKFYENSRFGPYQSTLGWNKEKKHKRKRLLTSEVDNKTSDVHKSGKMMRKKHSRKGSISDSEFKSFYNAFEQHVKSKKSNPTDSATSGFSSTKVSPDIKSVKKISNKKSNACLNLMKLSEDNSVSPKKGMRCILREDKPFLNNPVDANLQKLPHYSKAKMLNILNSLKQLEKQIK